MIHFFRRDQSSFHEQYMAGFDGGTCLVERLRDGDWRWSTAGLVYGESGVVRTKRWAMSEAVARISKIQKMKFKQPRALQAS